MDKQNIAAFKVWFMNTNALAVVLTAIALAILGLYFGGGVFICSELLEISGADAVELMLVIAVGLFFAGGAIMAINEAYEKIHAQKIIKVQPRRTTVAVILSFICSPVMVFGLMVNHVYAPESSLTVILVVVFAALVYSLVKFTKIVLMIAGALIAILVTVYAICTLVGGVFSW